MPTIIQFAKSKTILFSTALTVLGLAQGSLGVFNLDPMQQSYALMGIGIVSAVLRFLTTAPLSDK